MVQKMYARRPPLVYSFPFQRYACLFVNEPSKWPSIIFDDPGWQGDGAMAEYAGELFEYLFIGFSNPDYPVQ